MQFFAHIGITLGSTWVLQQAVGRIKHSVSQTKPCYAATGDLNNHTIEGSSRPVSVARWLDYRFLLLGSLLPDIIDKPLGLAFLVNGRSICHTLLFTMLILAAGTCVFIARKSPGLFCVALGCIAHILLDAMWLNPNTFFWPLFGWSFPSNNISIGPWVESLFFDLITKPSEYIPEIIGIFMLAYFYFGLKGNGKIPRLIKARQ